MTLARHLISASFFAFGGVLGSAACSGPVFIGQSDGGSGSASGSGSTTSGTTTSSGAGSGSAPSGSTASGGTASGSTTSGVATSGASGASSGSSSAGETSGTSISGRGSGASAGSSVSGSAGGSGSTGGGGADAGAPCTNSADCRPDEICGFPEAQGCAAQGTCFPAPQVTCDAIALGCACDCSEINIACNGLPGGYETKPFLHTGACGASTASTTDAGSLRWYQTCPDAVCPSPSDAGLPGTAGYACVSLCEPCTVSGATCGTASSYNCGVVEVCADHDPRASGCP